MFEVCPMCGALSPDKPVEAIGGTEAVAVCPACGARIPFRRLPLFVVTGPSGAGKSSLAMALPLLLPECVVLDNDVLWGVIPATPEDDFRSYHTVWLRLAVNIHQAGRSVVLCGTISPEQLEDSVERRSLDAIHYLALVCEERILVGRLKARPAWRDAGGDAFVARMVAFNDRLRTHAAQTSPPMTLLDTTNAPLDSTAREVAAWVGRLLGEQRGSGTETGQ